MTIAGDMNLDYLEWSDPVFNHIDMIDQVKEEVETLGFVQLVKGPTRFWPGTRPSLVDHFWTNCPDKIVYCKNVTSSVADHNIVITQIRLKGNPRSRLEYRRRKVKDLDVN